MHSGLAVVGGIVCVDVQGWAWLCMLRLEWWVVVQVLP